MAPITNWDTLTASAETEKKGFDPIPDGPVTATITEASVQIAKSSGNKQFAVTTVIDSGEYKNRKVWHNFTIVPDKPKSLRIFFENMAVFGMPIDFFNANTDDNEVVHNLLGKRFEANVITEEYNGKKNNKYVGYSFKEAGNVPDSVNEGVPSFASAPPVAPAPTPVAAPAPAAPNYSAAPTQVAPPAPPAPENPWGTPPPPPPVF